MCHLPRLVASSFHIKSYSAAPLRGLGSTSHPSCYRSRATRGLLPQHPQVRGEKRRPPPVHEVHQVHPRGECRHWQLVPPSYRYSYLTWSCVTPHAHSLAIASCGADLGSFTLLFRQPVAALQIRDPIHNEWKWIKPQDATLTVNACDAISFLTGGYVRSTIHRYNSHGAFCPRPHTELILVSVVAPPKDQQHVDRLGLLYFSR